MFQIVRRPVPLVTAEKPIPGAEAKTTREGLLSTALLTVLSVNVFIISGVLCFYTLAVWSPR